MQLHIAADAGGDWSIRREGGRWHLYVGAPDHPNARVTMGQDVAWRLFTKGLSPAAAEPYVTLEGDQRHAKQVLQTVAVIA